VIPGRLEGEEEYKDTEGHKVKQKGERVPTVCIPRQAAADRVASRTGRRFRVSAGSQGSVSLGPHSLVNCTTWRSVLRVHCNTYRSALYHTAQSQGS
jgi:hypothetical protein